MIYNATQAELEGEDRRTWTERDTDRRKVLEKSFHCVLGHGDFLKKIEVSSHDEEIQEESVCVCVSPSREHTEERCHCSSCSGCSWPIYSPSGNWHEESAINTFLFMFLMKNLHFYQKASRSCDPLNQIQYWNVFLYRSNDRRGDEETHLGIRCQCFL